MRILRAIVSFNIGLFAAAIAIVILFKVTTPSTDLMMVVQFSVWIAVGLAWYHRDRLARRLRESRTQPSGGE